MSTDYRVETRREDIQIELDGLMEYLFMQFEAQELPDMDKSIAKTQARIKELEAELESEYV